jgi:hypothetical protein
MRLWDQENNTIIGPVGGIGVVVEDLSPLGQKAQRLIWLD